MALCDHPELVLDLSTCTVDTSMLTVSNIGVYFRAFSFIHIQSFIIIKKFSRQVSTCSFDTPNNLTCM